MIKRSYSFHCLITAVLILLAQHHSLFAQFGSIKNDGWWYDDKGQPINSQGGGIFRFPEPGTGRMKYYWYGVHYYEADSFRTDPTSIYEKTNFRAVNCYSSTDLVNWKKEGDVFTHKAAFPDGKPTWAGRLGVAYIPELKLYALFIQHGRGVLIATSKTATGDFVWHRKIDMTERIGTPNTGDQTVFTDDSTGTSYLVYSYGRGRNKIYVSEIGVKNGVIDLLDCTKIFEGESREGNCMFRYNGKYYMYASNIYGWDGSYAYYLVADQVRGPYRPSRQMLVTKGCEADYAHVSQTGFFINVKGSQQETVVYCGDRWAEYAGNGLGYNVWVPLSFEGETPWFNSLHSWLLNATTGEWKPAADNNWVRNGSFEADRKAIPSTVKPVQTELTGWTTRVLSGTVISLDSTRTPFLNHPNSRQDRRIVIGEKSLYIHDKEPFARVVSQSIGVSPFVLLPNGKYTLTATVKSGGEFSQLEMFAGAGDNYLHTTNLSVFREWEKIRLEHIEVKNGQLEIGFKANGAANAFFMADDLTLLKEK